MATTYLEKHHISKGLTIAQSMKDRFDYGQNPDKTLDGELIAAYMCDPLTADAEFTLAKAKYKAITGREQKRDQDVLCYQVRQSFPPGEIDHEVALKIGYDLAMRWTKGKHAYFVVSHVDRPHPHIHVYYNSTSLDCTRKFRDFKGSARALRRLSDRICLENNLSIIHEPKLKSKGKYQHYGQWLGADKQPSYQEQVKAAIDTVLSQQPKDFAAFLAGMQAAGFEVKHGRGGVISFRCLADGLRPGQERFTRLRASTLGEGYGHEDIIAIIEGRAERRPSAGFIHAEAGRSPAAGSSPRKVNLIIDIQEKLKSGKGPAYERWAKIYNLKMMAAALQYLQENNLLDYEDLAAKAEGTVERFHTLAGEIQKVEAAMKRNAELKTAIIDYAKTRPVFEGYKAANYSKKYLAEHEADIAVYRAAGASIKELLNGEKLPKMDALKSEWQKLSAEKKALYSQYRATQKEMREVVAVRSNVDHLLGLTDEPKTKEAERQTTSGQHVQKSDHHKETCQER